MGDGRSVQGENKQFSRQQNSVASRGYPNFGGNICLDYRGIFNCAESINIKGER